MNGISLVAAGLMLAGSHASLMAQTGVPSDADSDVEADVEAGASTAQNTITIAPMPPWASLSDPLPVPEDAQGAIFVRRQDTLSHLSADGTHSFQGQLIRLLSPQALAVGNVAIAWNPAAGEAQVHALRIHRGSRVIDVLESTDFEILRREDQLEQAMLDGILTASLRVPDLRVGDDLEIAFTVPLNDPTLGSTSHGLLFLSNSPPLGRFRLGLSWDDGEEPAIQQTDDLEEVTTRGENAISMLFDNPATVAPPRDAPARYAWMRMIEFSDFAEWQDISRRFHPLYEEASALAPDSSVREEAALIAADHQSPMARAQAALQLVQQQIRYIYIGLNGGNYSPASADLTWERRYGDCKGKTVLLLALLRELGIEAEGVLVANDIATDGLEDRLPNPAMFDHIIVRATIDGRDYWMDGTLPVVIEAGERPYFPYQWVLPLSEKGEDIERLPEQPFELPHEMGIVDIDARGGFDQPAQIKRVTIKRGVSALQEYLALSSVSQNQLEAALKSRMEGNGEWDTIESIRYKFNRDTGASALTIVGTGPVDWDAGDEGRYKLTLPGGGFSPPSRRQRAKDSNAEAPYWQSRKYSCYATTVRFPDDTDPDNWLFNTTFDTMLFGRLYYRMMDIDDDGSLRMVRGSRVEDSEISAERAARDNDRIDDFDNSKAVLTYEPGTVREEWGNLRPVPAADEIDWTSADVPCLPPDMLEG